MSDTYVAVNRVDYVRHSPEPGVFHYEYFSLTWNLFCDKLPLTEIQVASWLWKGIFSRFETAPFTSAQRQAEFTRRG